MAHSQWKRLRAITLAGVTAAAITFASPMAASAGEPAPEPAGAEIILSDQQQLDLEATLAAVDTANKQFDAAAAAKAGASDQGIADFAAVLSAYGWTVSGAVDAPSAGVESIAEAARACTGYVGYHGYYPPWGQQFGLNSCQTSQVIAAVGLGAAGAGVVSGILVAVGVTAIVGAISGIVTAVLAFGAAAVAACQAFSSNGGIWLNVAGSPPVSCWGQ